jgi:L-fuconolactonase
LITDTHLHVWSLDRGDYDWLSPELGCLYADHALSELDDLFKQKLIKQVILVQAAATGDETQYLFDQAKQHKKRVAGVVGWLDFEANDALHQLDAMAINPTLVGIRPMLQDISPDTWILRSDFADIFHKLAEKKLVFDVLVKQNQLSVAHQLARRYANVTMVIDHCGKPDLDSEDSGYWLAELTKLAACCNVYIKLSGLPTQSKHAFNTQVVFEYVQQVFNLFGVNRVMWGSDWPVVKLGCDYLRWLHYCQQFCNKLGFNQQQQNQIFHKNACQVYGLTDYQQDQT